MSSDIAVVTGANSGIGRATALYLAGQGLTVYGTVRSVAKADKLLAMAAESGVTVNLVELDVADDQSVRDGFAEVLARAGSVDLLVNNAGVGPIGVAEHTQVSVYADTMNVNLYGAVRCVQAVLPGMRARRSGCIVNIGSIIQAKPTGNMTSYGASKGAVTASGRALATSNQPPPPPPATTR